MLRPTDTLPSTGLDILLVGPTLLCQPIAEMILQSPSDLENSKHQTEYTLPTSILDDHDNFLRMAISAKHVRMTPHLPIPAGFGLNQKDSSDEKNKKERIAHHPRVDYIVFVVSLTDATTLTTLESAVSKFIHEDYIYLRRIAIVVLHSENPSQFANYHSSPDLVNVLAQNRISYKRSRKRRKKDNHFAPETEMHINTDSDMMKDAVVSYIDDHFIPVLKCDLTNESSLLAVSKSVCKYAVLSSRGSSSYNSSSVANHVNSDVSPLFYSVLL